MNTKPIPQWARWCICFSSMLVLIACDGNFGSIKPGQGLGTKPSTQAVDVMALPESQLRRLTQQEYMHTIQDLLGSEIANEITGINDPVVPKQFSTYVAATVSMTNDDIQQYQNVTEKFVKARFANPELGVDFLGCTPWIDEQDPCIRTWLEQFGPRLLRRPFQEGELASYIQHYVRAAQRVQNNWHGVQELLITMFLSPKFLYRTEFGMPHGQHHSRQLNGYEIATRLSYMLWQTTPSPALLHAAQAGELDTAEGIAMWGKRLLADERARSAMVAYFDEWFNFQYIPNLSKHPNLYPNFSSELKQAMQKEFHWVVQDIIFDKQSPVSHLFNSPTTFLNPVLANHYGVTLDDGAPNIDGFQPYTFPQASGRSGVLTMAGFLAAQSPAGRTSPTERGLFIRSQILCQTLPDAPPNVPTLPGEMGPQIAQTMREQLEEHRTNPNCSSCHRKMDPIGLGLEHFDTTGAYRSTDNGLALDVSGDLDGVPFQNALGLTQALAQHERLLPCFATKLYTYTLGQDPKNDQVLAPIVEHMKEQGASFQALIEALITSDSFRYVGVQP